jgi:hypothetical protein
MIVSHWPMATMIGPGDDNISLVSHFISSPCSSFMGGLAGIIYIVRVDKTLMREAQIGGCGWRFSNLIRNVLHLCFSFYYTTTVQKMLCNSSQSAPLVAA